MPEIEYNFMKFKNSSGKAILSLGWILTISETTIIKNGFHAVFSAAPVDQPGSS